MFRCGNIVLWTTKFFKCLHDYLHYYYYPDVDSHSKFSVCKYFLSPLLLVILVTKFSSCILENDWKPALTTHKIVVWIITFILLYFMTVRNLLLSQRPFRAVYNTLSLTNSTFYCWSYSVVYEIACSRFHFCIENSIMPCSYYVSFLPPHLLYTH